MNKYGTIKVEPIEFSVGVPCLVCDRHIPIPNARAAYPKICDECKRRLNSLLYKEKDDETTDKT